MPRLSFYIILHYQTWDYWWKSPCFLQKTQCFRFRYELLVVPIRIITFPNFNPALPFPSAPRLIISCDLAASGFNLANTRHSLVRWLICASVSFPPPLVYPRSIESRDRARGRVRQYTNPAGDLLDGNWLSQNQCS